MKPYVVRQGDYLTRLAHTGGFDPERVWGDAKNADLKSARADPDILQAGDILHVPEPETKWLKLTRGEEHEYEARVPVVKVSVVVKEDGELLAGARYTVDGVGDDEEKVTDGDGLASFEVPLHTREAIVRFTESGAVLRVGVGGLDPISTDSGVRMRLEHLGFLGGSAPGQDPYEGGGKRQLAAALAAFQAAQKLTVTGEADEATRDALVAAHGS